MAPVPPAAAERQAHHRPLHAERPMRRAVAWLGGVALIVLAARSVVYVLSPSPLAAAVGRHAGGPALPAIAAVSLGLAVALAVAIVSLAAIGVAERRELETRGLAAPPPSRAGAGPRRPGARARPAGRLLTSARPQAAYRSTKGERFEGHETPRARGDRRARRRRRPRGSHECVGARRGEPDRRGREVEPGVHARRADREARAHHDDGRDDTAFGLRDRLVR